MTSHQLTPPPADAALTGSGTVRRRTERRALPGPGPDLVYDASMLDRGVPLVLLHGLSANSTSWAPVIDRFGDTWRTYALDFRGHGRSAHTPGAYAFDDYRDDANRLLHVIGEPSVVVGHSLGAIVAAALAQDAHPLVRAVFLEDPPIYLVEPQAFATSSFARVFGVLRDHVERLQAERAPVETYRDLLAASPHPAGDRLGDHLHDDALWSRAESLAQMDLHAIEAVLDGTTFRAFRPDRPLHRPALVLRADAAYGPGFLPEHELRLARTSPDVEVIAVAGAAHNIRGDRAGRDPFLDLLGRFLAAQHTTTLELQS